MGNDKNWKDAFTFLSPTFETHEVQGQKLNFYPISVKIIFEMKMLALPLAKALAVLFQKTDSDTGAVTETTENAKAGTKESRTVMEGLTIEMASLRDSQREDAIKTLLEAITEPNNAMLFGRLFLDSLRDMFTEEQRNNRDIALEFVKDMNLATFKEMLVGLMKANTKVLGPLESMVTQLGSTVLSGLKKDEEQGPAVTLEPANQEEKKADPETTGEI